MSKSQYQWDEGKGPQMAKKSDQTSLLVDSELSTGQFLQQQTAELEFNTKFENSCIPVSQH